MSDLANELFGLLTRGRKSKRAASGWTTICGVCCIHNGEMRPDGRFRGALKSDGESFIYTCRNCSYKARWRQGNTINGFMKSLLSWAGVSQDELRKLEFKAWQLREIRRADPDYKPKEFVKLEFAEKQLPSGSKPITHWLAMANPPADFMRVLTYLSDRGEDLLTGYAYYWTPVAGDSKDMHQRFIIPFCWQGKIVGWSARAIFPTRNRYYSDVPTNYFFNSEVIDNEWEYLFIHEGPLDAIAAPGIAMLGDKISAEQVQWIKQTGKIPIVVPDREEEGGNLVDIALREGWHVSFPRWQTDIKDAADAAKKYGRLYTIWSLIDARTQNKLQIKIERQRLK